MTAPTWIALAGFVVVMLVHTAVLFRWGGKMQTIVEHLVDWKTETSKWKHDHVIPRLFKVDELWRKSQGVEEES